MQKLDSPRNRNVVSNVAKEVMRNRQNRATGTSEIAPYMTRTYQIRRKGPISDMPTFSGWPATSAMLHSNDEEWV
jgi:hypothetical protein